MNNQQKTLCSAVVFACGAISTSAQAAMPDNATLIINEQTYTCDLDLGTPPDDCLILAVPANYFSMDTNGNGTVESSEKKAVFNNQGIILGKAQPASGSHTGAINGSEVPGIDLPWEFFGNTGMHQSVSAISILSDDSAGTVTFDMAGWSVTWNGASNIPMGGNPDFPADTGIANVSCANTCEIGDTFTLEYAVHVANEPESGFEKVPYTFHVEGVISISEDLTTNAGSIGNGTIAENAGSTDTSVTAQDLIDNSVPVDEGFTFAGGFYDFIVTGTGATAQIRIPLPSPIMADSVYRKYINNIWTTFTPDGTNLIASAAKVSGACPAVGDALYNHTNGLVVGDECLQLTIEDGGIYDDDIMVNGSISDPGGVGTPAATGGDDRVSGTDGCSMSTTPIQMQNRADWLLVGGFLALMGLFRLKRKQG